MVSLFNISKTFGFYKETRKVLDNISLSLIPGEVSFLCGSNGSGKSTLLKIASGLLDKDSNGQIEVEGKLANQKILRDSTLYVPQNIDDAMIDNLYLYEFINIFNVNNILNIVTEIEANWIYSLFISKKKILLRELSQGQRQFLLLLIFISKNEKIIFFDEIFSSIDNSQIYKLWHIIQSTIKNNNITTLLTNHDYNFAYNFGDRLLVLFNGKLVFDGTKDDITINQFNSLIFNGIK